MRSRRDSGDDDGHGLSGLEVLGFIAVCCVFAFVFVNVMSWFYENTSRVGNPITLVQQFKNGFAMLWKLAQQIW